MKKILMISSSWGSEYTKTIIDGIRERLSELKEGYELHVFNAYDDLQAAEYYKKDREIYMLPNPDDYDGLIMTYNSIISLDKIDEVADAFIKQDKPLISIDKTYDGATFCGLDNYQSMYRIVDHMITIHDCRTLNYVGGPVDHEEDKERFRAYCDCLNKHGITVDPKRVIHKTFMTEDGQEAYEEFKAYDYHMPDAVICANGEMAIGYTDAAIRDGILVPDYLKVSGFDKTMTANGHSPSITSIDRNWKQLGKDVADTLLGEIEGKERKIPRYTEGYIVYNESCGCERTRDIRHEYNLLVDADYKRGQTSANQMHVRQILINSRNYKDFQEGLKISHKELGYADIAVCVDGTFANSGLIDGYEGYSDDFNVFTENDYFTINRKKQLYPLEWKERGENTFVFSPLHYCDCTVGYSVMPYRNNFISRVKLRTLTEGISIAMGNIIMRRYISMLEDKK